jgi:hypothetical protein
MVGSSIYVAICREIRGIASALCHNLVEGRTQTRGWQYVGRELQFGCAPLQFLSVKTQGQVKRSG